MRTALFITAIAVIATSLSAQSNDPAPAKKNIRMFAPAQYDSVLSLIPDNGALKSGGDIIGIGLDTPTKSVVVIAFDKDGNPVKLVFPDSTLVKSKQAATPRPGGKHDEKGRTWFITETVVKSSVVYSMAYQGAFPRSEGSVLGGLSLLTIGGSLYGSFAFTKNLELGYGRVGLMNYGSTLLGLHFPQLLGSLLKNTTPIDDNPDSNARSSPSEKVRAWVSMAGFPLGIYIGSRWNIVDRNDGGKMTLIGFFSQPTAYVLGYGLPMLFMVPNNDLKDYFGVSSLLTMMLIPSGFYAGYKIAGDSHLSAGRGSLPYVSGIMGGLTGALIPVLFDLDYNELSTYRIIAATALSGYGGGTALGMLYHSSTKYTYKQTVFIGLSSLAAAGIAEAFPLIAKSDDKDSYILAGILGAWTGFFVGERLSLSLFEKSDRDQGASNISVSLPGLAALPMLLSKDRNSSASRVPALPMANLEWRF
jgi:hypothetical protein